MKLAVMVIAVGTVFMADLPVSAQTVSPGSKLAWAGEARYWAAREAGNYADYVGSFDGHFIGWPCRLPNPEQRSDLKTITRVQPGVVMDRKSSLVGSGFVITYYRATGRIELGDGKTRDFVQYYTHTWIPTGDGWKIIGGMCRPARTE